MINQPLSTNLSMHKPTPFGMRLKSAREALGMDRKDVAAHLRLNEKMIIMIESGEYKTDVPMTFIRGYIRSYSKLVEIPEKELHEAMELLKPKPEINEEVTAATASSYITVSGPASTTEFHLPINFNTFFMRFFTFLLAITLVGLVGVWWHNHKSTPNDLSIQNQVAPIEKMADTTTEDQTSSPQAPTTDNSALPGPENNLGVMTKTNPAAGPENTVTAPPAPAPQPTTPVATSTVNIPTVAPETGKNAFNQLMHLNHSTQLLMSLILFLIILTVSLRAYAKPTLSGVRTTRSLRHIKKPTFDLDKLLKLDLKSPTSLSVITIVLVFILGSAWWYYHSSKPFAAPFEKQTTIAKEQQGQDANQLPDILLMTNLEILLPSSSLYSLLLAGYQPYALQAMMMELDQAIDEADASKFALTDKSMPIGQFVGKKHHRHRYIYYTTVPSNSVNPAVQTENPPPYYNQQ